MVCRCCCTSRSENETQSSLGRKAEGSLQTIANVGDRVLPTVQAIADVTGHPLAGAAVEGLRRGVNAMNNINGKVQHVRNAFQTV